MAALVSGLDLSTKTIAMKTPTSGAPSWILRHVIGLDRVNHPGVWHGSDLAAALTGAVFVLCLVLAAMQWLSRLQQTWVAALGGVVLGGLIGNNVDRISHRLVTDWLLIRVSDTGNIVVNLADVAIALGVVLAMVVVAWGLCRRLWSSAPPPAIQTRTPGLAEVTTVPTASGSRQADGRALECVTRA